MAVVMGVDGSLFVQGLDEEEGLGASSSQHGGIVSILQKKKIQNNTPSSLIKRALMKITLKGRRVIKSKILSYCVFLFDAHACLSDQHRDDLPLRALHSLMQHIVAVLKQAVSSCCICFFENKKKHTSSLVSVRAFLARKFLTTEVCPLIAAFMSGVSPDCSMKSDHERGELDTKNQRLVVEIRIVR